MLDGPKCAELIVCRFCEGTNKRPAQREREGISAALMEYMPDACGLAVPDCIVNLLLEFVGQPQDYDICNGYGRQFTLRDGRLTRRTARCVGREQNDDGESANASRYLRSGECYTCTNGLNVDSCMVPDEDDSTEDNRVD